MQHFSIFQYYFIYCICAPGEEELGLAVSHNLWVIQTHVVLQYSNSL